MNRPTTDDQMLTELFVSVPAPQVPIGDDLRRVRRYRSRRRWARASTVVATVVLAAGVGWLVVPSGGDDAPGPVGRSTEAPTEAPTDHQSVRDALADLLGPDRVGEVPETTVWDNRVDGIDGFVPSWGMELPWAEPGQDGRGNLMVDFFPSATPLTCEDLFAGIGNKPTCDPVTGPLPAGVEEAVVIIEPASDGPAPRGIAVRRDDGTVMQLRISSYLAFSGYDAITSFTLDEADLLAISGDERLRPPAPF